MAPYLSDPDMPHTIGTNGVTPRNMAAITAKDVLEPIAIIGIGGRFPGEATNPEKLWDLICKGQSAMSEVPKDRFNIDAFYHPHAERQGTMNVRGGHYMQEDVACFDAPFFSITPQEANAMDPQQRLALEVAYESLENAGLRIEDVAGSPMACFMASFTRDYANLRSHDAEDIPKYEGTGNGAALISNRISWFFDLKGPSLSLDTACSSSLVALHLACQSLRSGESKTALVGGTNLLLMPEMQIAMTSLHFLSPDSKCQAFDHKANGYSRGEGAAVITLKPLADALRDNNVIRAVIRGTGVNQDGKTPGITLPSAEAQEELIRTTYQSAGLDFSETNYFEAHGTGTPAGDPLEASAIGATFGASRSKDNPIPIGSIKTNIGHMEGASGLAGLIKSVYALEKGIIPPNLWFEKPNPRIPMTDWNITIPTKLTYWPTQGLRRASVNSFGYGGTNAHCILDDAYNYLTSRGLKGAHRTVIDSRIEDLETLSDLLSTSSQDSTWSKVDGNESDRTSYSTTPLEIAKIAPAPKLFYWSSHEQNGVERTSKALLTYLLDKTRGELPEDFLDSLVYTLSECRSRLSWKTYAVATTVEELVSILEQGVPKPLRASQVPSLGFIFTGQGAQWYAMGRELLCYATFRQSLEAATAYLESEGCTWNLFLEFVRDKDTSCINKAAISQATCTALQVALVDLLAEWNIRPTAVIGHSSGEIAAAYAKGAISREDAWKIAYHRGRLSNTITRDGGMMAVGLGQDAIQPYLDKVTDGEVVVACINSPSNVTLSGDSAAITQVQEMLEGSKVFARRLNVKTAYHSPHIKAIADEYRRALQNIRALKAGDTGAVMFSSVTGKPINADELGPDYWVDNMISPVNFLQAVSTAVSYSTRKRRTARKEAFINVLLEVGPHAALQGPIKQILQHEKTKTPIPYVSVLSRGNDATRTALEALGKLNQHGYPADLTMANTPGKRATLPVPLTDLPPFAWNHMQRYWYESPISAAYRQRKLPRHDLLGALSEHCSDLEPSWRNYLRVAEMPWIEHHKVQSSILYPLSGMMVMAIEGIRQISDKSKEIEGFQLRDVAVGTAMVVPADEPIETKLQFRPWRMGSRLPDAYWKEFTISCRTRQGVWSQHCSGLISVKYKKAANTTFTDEELEAKNRHRAEYHRLANAGFKPDDPRQVYAAMAELGLQWGPSFTTLVHISSGDYEAHCMLEVPDTKKYMPENFEYPHVIHPACLDGFVQMMIPASTPTGVQLDRAKIPRFIESLYISAKVPNAPGTRFYGYSKSKPYGFNESIAMVAASTSEWEEPFIVIEGCRNISLETMTESLAAETITKSLRKLGAHPTWDIDLEHLPLDRAVELLGRYGQEVPDADSEVIQTLELASFILCKRVLRQFGPDDSQTFAHHHRIFYEYMQHQYELATQGKLNCQRSIPNVDWLNTTDSFEEEVLARAAASTVDGKLMCRLGADYDKILRGELEPLQLMREDDLLTQYYRNGIGVNKWNPIIAKYVQLLSHKKDLKILEVGAGTGGTTSVVLEALGNRHDASMRLQSYTFTDISSGFFEKASEEFAPWAPFLQYKVLNIEKDAGAQGMPMGEYDLVIANNVLHATSSISACLKNCRNMLKPGGVLLLGELTCTLARIPMIFGTLPGWWMGENDGRKYGPRLSEKEWEEALRQAGFSGLDMCFRDHKVEEEYSVSLMLSSAAPETPASGLPEKAVLVQPSQPAPSVTSLCSKLIEALTAKGTRAELVSAEDLDQHELAGKTCISFLEADTPLLYQASQDEFEAVKRMILQSESTLWLTRGAAMESSSPESNIIAGLGRTIRGEIPHMQLTTLDLDPAIGIDDPATVLAINSVLQSGMEAKNVEHPDWEYALRNGMIHTVRLDPDAPVNEMLSSITETPDAVPMSFKQPGRPLALAIKSPGMLDTFQFVNDEEYSQPLSPGQVEIAVKAVGMNFHDVMIAMGQIADTDLGVECSGIVTRVGSKVTKYKVGDRVITFRLGCFRNFLRNPEEMFQKIPDSMSFEDAASIPCIYSTVYYSLFDVAHLQQGESVLIHAAAGGLGQAAIILCQYIGAEIFVTVSSETKKRFLVEEYGIAEDHIFNSRDLSFAQGIKRMTNGKGVDVVLNSLAGEALRQSWLAVAPFGRFIELGKKDIVGNTGIDMAPFMNNIRFCGVNMLSVYRDNIPLFGRIIADMMRMVSEGIIRPVKPLKVFNFSQIEEVFRIMQTGKHIGKMVLQANDDDLVPVVPQKARPAQLAADATYLIPGGLGGLGRSLAQRMADQGARNLIFTSRSGDKRPEAKKLLANLRSQGVHVKAYACDISDASQLDTVLQEAAVEFPPIRGVVTCAMHLQDVFFENMTVEDYHAAIRPKVQATRNLHDLLPKDLDFFICLSSVGGIVGSRGQGNYNAGNTYQDAICHHRRALGLNSTSINLGVVLGVGITAERGEILSYLKTGAMIGVREQEVLALIEAAMNNSTPTQVVAGLATGGLLNQNGHDEPYWFGDGRFSHMRIFDTQEFTVSSEDAGQGLHESLAAAQTMGEASDVVCRALMQKLAKAMMMELEDLDASRPANSYGVDSLVAVEVRAWVFKEAKSDVSVFDILSNDPLTALAAKIAAKSSLLSPTVQREEE
ncbi:lovastatin nonaketide synthase [Aspergillus udagawae]|nr:lovastatin nonaketide synthase [Aspergillus udagawae]GFG11483.1 lovastatin nonaketide synthase [Aspergillus udagawae]